MKKLRSFIIGILVISIVLVSVLTGCSPVDTSKLKVVTSTSLLAYIAQQVGDDRVDVINLIPPTQHPGDFNVKPSDIEKLASASLFLLHGWPGEGYADKMIASAGNSNLTVFKANVSGNWMIPSVQLAATDKVANALSQVDSKSESAYNKSAEEYKQRIAAKEAEIKAKLAKTNVINNNLTEKFYKISTPNYLVAFNMQDIFVKGPVPPKKQASKQILAVSPADIEKMFDMLGLTYNSKDKTEVQEDVIKLLKMAMSEAEEVNREILAQLNLKLSVADRTKIEYAAMAVLPIVLDRLLGKEESLGLIRSVVNAASKKSLPLSN